MDVINEGTTTYLTAAFFDKAGAPAIPASLTYQVEDVRTGTVLRAPTAITPAASVEITLNGTDNSLVSDTAAIEQHRVIVIATYGEGDQCKDRYLYEVKRLTWNPPG